MTALNLKPCPFCGGEASACPDPSHSTGWDIGCFNGSCEIEPHVWSVHRETAEMQWNTRPETDRLIAEAMATERERIARMIEGTAYTSNSDGRSLEPVSAGLAGMDMHHATIAAAIRGNHDRPDHRATGAGKGGT